MRLHPHLGSAALAFVWASAVPAQQPLGSEVVVASSSVDATEQVLSELACDGNDVCAVIWSSFRPSGTQNNELIWGATYSQRGDLVARRILSSEEDTGLGLAHPVGLATGFAIFWDRTFQDGRGVAVFQRFDENLIPQSGVIETPFHKPSEVGDALSYEAIIAVRQTEDGFVFLSPANSTSDPLGPKGIFLYFLDPAGRVLRPGVRVSEEPTGDYRVANQRGGLALDGHGNLIVAYARRIEGQSGPLDVYVRRLSRAGEALGPDVRVNTFLRGEQGGAQVAASPDGEFLVVWQSADQDGSNDGIYARRFSSAGKAMAREFLVNQLTASAQRFPHVTSDAAGNYFVSWSSGHPTSELIGYEVKGRLYRHDGKPVAGEVHLNQGRLFDQIGGEAAFLRNGTLLTAWSSASPDQRGDAFEVPVARRFSASLGHEICTITGATISCHLGRTGGSPQLQLSWAGRPGETTLFGDWNGDGRDDLCAFFRGRFRCDLNHDGPPAEAAEAFGRASDTPLLADVNGDGRADPCLRRGADLLCDTRHDGQVDVQIRFGEGTETPLLGDLNGDGRADLCLYEAEQWSCRLAGSGRIVQIPFGQPGDMPALGDVDRDGRADPCLLRAGLLLCDTRHDGGAAEVQISFGAPVVGSSLLFGNLDGL